MQLLTSDLKDRLLRNGRASAYAAASGRDFDPPPVVKLFTPDAQATWLLTELDPACEWRAFGLCDLGCGMPELGFVDLRELSEVRGPLGLSVERDLHFVATKPLSQYAEEADQLSRIAA